MRLVVALTLSLLGCGRVVSRTVGTPVTGPDGTKNWAVIECTRRADCFKIAGETCPHAYELANDSSEETASHVAYVDRYAGISRRESRRQTTMLIHCVPYPHR